MPQEPFTLLPSQRENSGRASTAAAAAVVVVGLAVGEGVGVAADVGVAVGLAADVVNQLGLVLGLGLAAGVVKQWAMTGCRTPKRVGPTALTVSHSAPVEPQMRTPWVTRRMSWMLSSVVCPVPAVVGLGQARPTRQTQQPHLSLALIGVWAFGSFRASTRCPSGLSS